MDLLEKRAGKWVVVRSASTDLKRGNCTSRPDFSGIAEFTILFDKFAPSWSLETLSGLILSSRFALCHCGRRRITSI
jgi:hypothetical protein